MQQQDIESVYEELATAIDIAGEQQAAIFLAQVCLLLARDLNDRDLAIELIRQAARPYQDITIASPARD